MSIGSFGKPSTPSPTGTFKITEKAPNPGGVFGTRWMRFYKGYGIHDTNNPASIGKAVSNGCIRMHNQDANYVYSLVPIGTEVNVVSSQTTDRYYVVQAGDTLFSISQKLGVNYDALLRENNITDPNMIYVCQKLLIPRSKFKRRRASLY
nr:L,D-transpeptidase family protein [Anaerosolibacter carboniphilus]